jgi:hypothetical protein
MVKHCDPKSTMIIIWNQGSSLYSLNLEMTIGREIESATNTIDKSHKHPILCSVTQLFWEHVSAMVGAREGMEAWKK